MSASKAVKIAVILVGQLMPLAVTCQPASANDFTAEKVMKHMNGAERYSYLAGVVEGLAIARYMKDGKQKQGMECIYDWFYDDKQNMKVIMEAFERYASYPPGSILHALIKRKCGE